MSHGVFWFVILSVHFHRSLNSLYIVSYSISPMCIYCLYARKTCTIFFFHSILQYDICTLYKQTLLDIVACAYSHCTNYRIFIGFFLLSKKYAYALYFIWDFAYPYTIIINTDSTFYY